MTTSAPLYFDEFEAIAETVPGAVLIARDCQCREVIGNRAACTLLRVQPGSNLSRHDPQAAPHFQLWHEGTPVDADAVPLARAARGETISDYELEVRFDDGSMRYLFGNAMPLYDPRGAPRGAMAAYADLTERRRAERALRESEAKLRFTLRAARIGTWHWDVASGAVRWSDDLEAIHEMPAGSFGASFEAFLQRVDSNQRNEVLATIERALAQGDEYRTEYREQRDGGSIGWIEGRGQVERDQAGQATGINGIAMDITERKRAEEALRESEERLRFTLDAARIGTWSWDIATGEVGWSDNLPALYQRPADAFDGTFEGFVKGVHPHDRDTVVEAIRGAVHEGREYALEHRIARADGATGWLECRGRVERNAAGEAVRMTGICMDVTDRKHAEEMLRALADAGTTLASSLDYETALEQVADMLVPGWGDWCVIDVLDDAGALETVAVAHADADRVEHARALRREYPPRLDAPTGVGYVVRTGEPLCFPDVTDDNIRGISVDQRQYEIIRQLGLRSGLVVPLIARGRTLGSLTLITAETRRRYDEDDLPQVQELARRCAFAVDNARLYREAQSELAERRRAQDSLAQLNETLEQRVASRTALAEHRSAQLRSLAGELAHAEQRERRRLAQRLHDDHQQVLIAAKLQVGMLQQSDAPAPEGFSKLEELLEEAVQSARTVSRELSPTVLYDAGLAAALRWLATVKQEKHGLHVHVEAEDDANPDAEDVSIFLYQAVRELLLNIVKHANTDEAWVRMSPHGDGQVQIEVEDRGSGFNPEQMPGADVDGGQFGLFGMRERLALLEGTLSLDSDPGDGTRVTMLAPRRGHDLPRTQAHPATMRPGRIGEPGGGEREIIRVLLADDHKMLRDGLAGLLKAESDIELVGQAEDGEQAVALARELRPDVVVMDISMPRVNGLEATRRIREQLPTVAIVGLSMHDNAEMAEAMRRAGAATYLSKSGAAGGLVSAIRAHGSAWPAD